jgi:hypothetical protein
MRNDGATAANRSVKDYPNLMKYIKINVIDILILVEQSEYYLPVYQYAREQLPKEAIM